MDKAELRKETVRALRSFGERKSESEAIIAQLSSLDEWKTAETILAFSPMRDEVDITPLLADGRILLPYVENGMMYFAEPRRLQRSTMGFLEPEHVEAEYGEALMLVPLVGYNEKLYRLGRGGGFYDRYISSNGTRLKTIGLALSPSFLPSLKRRNMMQSLMP